MRPWRAFDTFLAALGAALLVLLGNLVAATLLWSTGGDLSEAATRRLLGALYWGTYPVVFVALGALLWHFVRSYRGDYAAS